MRLFIYMEQNQPRKPWWHAGMMIFAKVSAWIAGPIVIALFLGRYLDGRFGTKPFIFLALTFLAFGVSSYGIIKETYRSLRDIEKEDDLHT